MASHRQPHASGRFPGSGVGQGATLSRPSCRAAGSSASGTGPSRPPASPAVTGEDRSLCGQLFGSSEAEDEVTAKPLCVLLDRRARHASMPTYLLGGKTSTAAGWARPHSRFLLPSAVRCCFSCCGPSPALGSCLGSGRRLPSRGAPRGLCSGWLPLWLQGCCLPAPLPEFANSLSSSGNRGESPNLQKWPRRNKPEPLEGRLGGALWI